MSGSDGSMFDYLGILAVFLLVAANGFFVAAEFSLVSVRRSRVTELVAQGRMNASALQHAVDNLDANLPPLSSALPYRRWRSAGWASPFWRI